MTPSFMTKMRVRRTIATVVGAVAVAAGGLIDVHPSDAETPGVMSHASAKVDPPPTTASCLASDEGRCYSPHQLQVAYRTIGLYHRNIDGRGRTIAIVDPFGSPTIRHDLHVFDKAFGLPDPSLRIISPAGKLPKFDHTNRDMLGWAGETTLDVEYAHAIAPRAKILLVATPTAQTAGVHGLPQIVKAENYVINHHLADVISQSFGSVEPTFTSKAELLRLRSAVKNAAAHAVTMVASSGDFGATNLTKGGLDTSRHRVSSWPSTDPLVTSIGGTQLTLDARGHRIRRDVVWADRPDGGAGGGGTSMFFPRPAFQNSMRGRVGSHRGTPDLSLSAAGDGSAIIYSTFDYVHSGWETAAGTSLAAPMFAGIVGLAAQKAGHRLGDLNPAIYALRHVKHSGIVDVTSGNNSYAGVTGFRAAKGYDMASGVGTIDAELFVPALARMRCS